MNAAAHYSEWMDRLTKPALRTAGASALLAVVLALAAPTATLLGCLCAFILCTGMPMGGSAVLMLHHLTGGRWGVAVRTELAAMAVTTPVLILFFLPVAIGVTALYPWAVERDPALPETTRRYLSVGGFLIRSAAFLLIWSAGAWLVVRCSWAKSGSQTAQVGYAARPAAVGLLIYVVTTSFAAVDWIGSLEPAWYSAMFGLYVIMGQVVSALALIIVLVARRRGADDGPDADRILQDVATLLLTAVVLHAYFAYSQFFIIWNGNLPREIGWYLPRMRGIWGAAALVLIAAHFVAPLLLLSSRDVKRRPRVLTRIAILILAARCLEAAWFVLPSYRGSVSLVLVAAGPPVLALSSLWLVAFNWSWNRVAAVRDAQTPQQDGS